MLCMEINPERFLSETQKCICSTSFKRGNQIALNLIDMNRNKLADEKFPLYVFGSKENDQDMGESKEDETLLDILDTESVV